MPDTFLDQPILAAWQEIHRERPDSAAIFGSDGSVLRTFRDIENEASSLALKIPAGPEGIVIIQIGNHPSLPALLLTLWRSRRVVALAERGAVCELPGVSLLVARDLPGELQFLPVDGRLAEPIDADFLKLTSGTTGAPRAIRFSAKQLLADCAAVCDTMGLTSADLNYGVISWAHSYGFSNLVLPLLCRGIPLVATEDRLPRAILHGLSATKATVFPAVPVFFQKLAELASPELPSLRLCISAGAPLSASVATRFSERFGLKIHSFYGSSECGGICYDASDSPVPEGCVGDAMLGVRIEHNEGRIEIHSPAAGLGYWPDAEPSVLGNGRFIPGDLVEKTQHGYQIRGRVSDIINVAGRKLNPAEVEAVLKTHPNVREAIVFGVPSPMRGEEPVACVVGDIDPAALLTFVGNRLPSWQVPKDIWIVEAKPVNERGKLNRRALSEQWQRRATG